jgi:hypothetical protein
MWIKKTRLDQGIYPFSFALMAQLTQLVVLAKFALMTAAFPAAAVMLEDGQIMPP